jgi:anhydro-N-acetylmuramic acid kinase
MSGTSADAIDAALVCFDDDKPRLLAHHSLPLSLDLRAEIHRLAQPGDNELDRCGALDHRLGEAFAETVMALLKAANISADAVSAIGSHGQTLRHRPPGLNPHPFTLQIGDPNIIAQRTGITTVADFRRRDMAAGGQGAPLVPAFHRALFGDPQQTRAIVNIGGMANISWLRRDGKTLGFDTGPGNVLMDAWIQRHQNLPYDRGGAWAASGDADAPLLKRLLEHPFFTQAPPKSTGREVFNLDWLKAEVDALTPQLTAADVQATLLQVTAQSIAASIRALDSEHNAEVYLCGGGAYNTHLVNALRELLPDNLLASTAQLDIAPQWLEAIAFAWLARQTLAHLPGNLPSVTGAEEPVILGGIYFA